MFDKSYKHESYGQISISRVQCNGAHLFGSSIKHNSFISLKINQSEMVKDDLYNTNYFGRDKIIEVNMSSAQFAELITTLNYGAGTPCTIDWVRDVGKVKYEKPFEEDANQQLEDTVNIEKDKFKERISELNTELTNVLNKKNINKKDREELKKKIDILIRDCVDNYKFAEQQFRKNMENHITECKSEIESTLTTITSRLGEKQINNLDQIGD